MPEQISRDERCRIILYGAEKNSSEEVPFMRCNPPSLRPLVFNLYQAQLTHLPTIGGGGG